MKEESIHPSSSKIRFAENWFTCEANGCVKIRESFEINEDLLTIPMQFEKIAKMHPETLALVHRENHEWKTINYRTFYDTSRVVAKAFLKLGLQRYHSVCVLSATRPEWFYANMAAIMCGGFSTGLYAGSSAEACLHNLKLVKADIILVDSDEQFHKIRQIKDQFPNTVVIQFVEFPTDQSVLSWNSVLKMGNEEPDNELDTIISSLAVNECCSLVFTSGTSSLSKAVMLSHDNLLFNAKMMVKYLKLGFGCERFLSYLPLNHIAAQNFDFYIAIICAACVYCPNKNVLKEDIIPVLRYVKPTVFIAVPRIWEKIKNSLQSMEKIQHNGVKSYVLHRAMSICLAYHEKAGNRILKNSWEYKFHQRLILNVFKEAVGLSNCRCNFSLGAPISTDIKRYLMSFDVSLGEAYGMSECGGGHLCSIGDDVNLQGFGKTIPGVRSKIHKPDKHGVGELCIYGRHVFMGYLNDVTKTEETIDKDGWLHTGDIAFSNEESQYKLSGRIKELMITTGGKKISPLLIEPAVKNEIPIVSEAVVIADGKKFVSLLITLKCEKNLSTNQPADELCADSKAWCRSVGSLSTTVSEILRENPPLVMKALQDGIDKVNEKVCSCTQKIRKFTILPCDFTVATGELSETMKLKRYMIYEKYKKEIDSMYSV